MCDNMAVICRKLLPEVYERSVLKVFDSVGSEGMVFLLFFLKAWEPDTCIWYVDVRLNRFLLRNFKIFRLLERSLSKLSGESLLNKFSKWGCPEYRLDLDTDTAALFKVLIKTLTCSEAEFLSTLQIRCLLSKDLSDILSASRLRGFFERFQRLAVKMMQNASF